MSGRSEYEMMFRLNGQMGGEFTRTFRSASTEVNALRTAMRNTNSTLNDIGAYSRQQNAIDNTSTRLQNLRQRQEEIQAAMDATEQPSERLQSQYANIERQIQSTTRRLEEQTQAHEELRTTLQNAGIDTDNLADETANLRQQYEQLSDSRRYVEDISSALSDQKTKLKESSVELGLMAGAYTAAGTALYGATSSKAINFESAFAGVTKTVSGTAEELEEIREGILDMSQNDVTASASEIAAVAEAAGQLGIQTENILDFSRVMIDLGESTNLGSDEAASELAKFANVTQMAQDNFDELGSVIVDLGNNYATTEADIVAMGTRLASTGELTGLSEAEIMGLATALSSLGIEAEAGGTAASKLLKQFANAAANGDMKDYADIAGMTEEAFAALYNEDSLAAISKFTQGLNDEARNGRTAIQILNDMGINEERLSNAVLALASSDDILTKAVATANAAWEENTALTIEAEKRYATTESRMQMTANSFENLGIVLGDMTLPYIKDIADEFTLALRGAQRWVDNNSETIEAAGELALKIAGGTLALKGMQVAYHGINVAGLTVAKGIGKVTAAVTAAKAADKGARLSTFASSLTGLTANTAGYIAVGAGAVTTIAAVAAALWAQHEAATAVAVEYAEGLLFDNGLPSLEEYTEALKDSTDESFRFAQETNETCDELDEISYEMSLARSEVELYGTALREDGTLSTAEAEALKEPFGELVAYLKDDFEKKYSLIFDNFKTAVSGLAESANQDIHNVTLNLDAFNKKYVQEIDEAEAVVTGILDKMISGEEISTETMASLKSQLAFVSDMSAADSASLYEYNQAVAAAQGVNFGGNKQDALDHLDELNQYAVEYIAELDEAQDNLNRKYQELRNTNDVLLKHGRISVDEYTLFSEALDFAQSATYQDYLSDREAFIATARDTYGMLRSRLDITIKQTVENGDLKPTHYWIGALAMDAAMDAGEYNTGKTIEDFARGALRTSVEKDFADLQETINNGINALNINPIQIPVEIINGAEAAKTASNALTAYNPSDPYNLAQYDVAYILSANKKYDPADPYNLAQYATGTNAAARGLALVGEQGPELVDFNGGERVYTAEDTRAILESYETVAYVLPQVLAAAVAPMFTGGSVTVNINSSPTFNAAADAYENHMDSYNANLAEHIKRVISEMSEDAYRNAYR